MTDDSQLETIEGHQTNNLSTFFIPKNFKNFDEYFFANITEIGLSPQNPLFQIIDDNYLLKKSDTKSDIFDELVWVNRQLNNTIIPCYIKKIYPYAIFCRFFSPQISFEEGSIIETIDKYFFPYDCNYEKIVFPSSVKVVKNNAIERSELLLTIIFQSEEISFEKDAICRVSGFYCNLHFPNAKKIHIDCLIPEEFVIHVMHDAELTGVLFKDENKCHINYIDDVSVPKKKLDQLFEYIRSLENQLSEYKEIKPFDLNSFIKQINE